MQTTFDDVHIPEGIIDTLRTAVSLPLFCPSACSSGILSSESSAGVLLYGPPGTGKTMACRAVAKECGVRMLQIQSSTIQRCLVGETEQLIASIFKLARRLGPCVVFIDELDAIFGSRDSGKKPVWYISALTEFMQEMDGLRSADFNRDKGLIVIGATNRPQDLDNAILRRLPRRILVDLPVVQERQKILEHYLAAELKSDDLELPKLAMQTRLFSGSDLRHLVLAAAQNALKRSVNIRWKRGGGTDPKSAVQSVKPLPICMEDFKQARKEISPSSAANHKLLEEMRRWGKGERIQKDDC
ncbi:AAA-domain-containing protein [Exidia glandulosa HHB12029]|uniref:AAA-domain-containing protein n=1 Tax=Exidia glandulosa HHB12029 TaxID=1314781 RepID=A0A165MZU4_EXIGL|nr:AAA-domain-containing protein [Exidia glandulosa HHB12029]